MRVAVCVITFRRCAELRRLLDSIAGLKFQETSPEVSVRIIDNDPKGSARGVVDEMATTFPFELIYDIEPSRGISVARNRAVAMAAAADFVAFIDDDETVCPGWLEQLLMEQSSSAADVVMGPVQPLFVMPPPEWIARGGFFVKDYKKFGKIDENYGSTANILIRTLLPGPFERTVCHQIQSDWRSRLSPAAEAEKDGSDDFLGNESRIDRSCQPVSNQCRVDTETSFPDRQYHRHGRTIVVVRLPGRASAERCFTHFAGRHSAAVFIAAWQGRHGAKTGVDIFRLRDHGWILRLSIPSI